MSFSRSDATAGSASRPSTSEQTVIPSWAPPKAFKTSLWRRCAALAVFFPEAASESIADFIAPNSPNSSATNVPLRTTNKAPTTIANAVMILRLDREEAPLTLADALQISRRCADCLCLQSRISSLANQAVLQQVAPTRTVRARNRRRSHKDP